jgi:DNA-binding LacI/PurR family transcriptional regulator
LVTTRDIAERLQLSVSTVGRALADDARISEQTKLRVRQAAAEMGYVGNLAARMMRGASSNVVGLVIPDIRNSFYVTIAHELSTIMVAQNFQLMLAETNDDRATELRQLRELAASRVAGVVIVPTSRPHGDAVKLLEGIPHVQLLRKHASLGSHWFGLDDHGALREATRHLIDLGHTAIGYVGGPAERSTGRQRLDGYRQALRDGNTPGPASLVELGPPSSVEHGREAVGRLLELSAAPTAVVWVRCSTPSACWTVCSGWASRCPRSCRSSVSATRPGSPGGGPGSRRSACPSRRSPPPVGCGWSAA